MADARTFTRESRDVAWRIASALLAAVATVSALPSGRLGAYDDTLRELKRRHWLATRAVPTPPRRLPGSR